MGSRPQEAGGSPPWLLSHGRLGVKKVVMILGGGREVVRQICLPRYLCHEDVGLSVRRGRIQGCSAEVMSLWP